jgi:hypothetical protein
VVKPERELGSRQDEVDLVRSSQEARCRGGRPRRARGEAPAFCPCRRANRWPWRWCSRRRCLVLLRRPARETSQSEKNAYYNTENREQAQLGVLLLACRHRPLADIMRLAAFGVKLIKKSPLFVRCSVFRTVFCTVLYGVLRRRTVLYGA